jgi:hypothetical protein
MNAPRPRRPPPPRPPRRLLDALDAPDALDDGASPLERDLLRSAPSIDPPAGAQARVWAAVLTKLPPLSGPPGGPGDGGASAAGKAAAAGKTAVAVKGAGAIGAIGAGAGLLKSVLIGAGGAVALIATYTAVAPAPRPEPVQRPVAVVAAPVVASPQAGRIDERAVRAPEPVASPAALANANANADRRVPSEPRATAGAGAGAGAVEAVPAPAPVEVVERERETMLREEGRLVGEARDSLRRGDATGALAQLEQIRARFPGGALAQEREALAIEALARSGQRAAASNRAAAFLRAYPTSQLAERVQEFAK